MTFDDMVTKSPELASFASRTWKSIVGDYPMPDKLIADILEGMGDISQHMDVDAILSAFGFQMLCLRQLSGSFDGAEVGYQQLLSMLKATDPELLQALEHFVAACGNIATNIGKYVEEQPVVEGNVVSFTSKRSKLY